VLDLGTLLHKLTGRVSRLLSRARMG
jgi:hypothetical protein